MNILVLGLTPLNLPVIAPLLRVLSSRPHVLDMPFPKENLGTARVTMGALGLTGVSYVPRPRGWSGGASPPPGGLLGAHAAPPRDLVRDMTVNRPDLLVVLADATTALPMEALKVARRLGVPSVHLLGDPPNGAPAPDLTLASEREPSLSAARIEDWVDRMEAVARTKPRPWRPLPGARTALGMAARLVQSPLFPFSSGPPAPSTPEGESVWTRRLRSPLTAPETRQRHRASERLLRRLARTRQPIHFGPWTGSADRELLYWIPYVRWIVTALSLPGDRLIHHVAAGREHWYADLPGRIQGAPENAGPESAEPGQDGAVTVTPAHMVDGFTGAYWEGRAPLDVLLQRSIFLPLGAPDSHGLRGFPQAPYHLLTDSPLWVEIISGQAFLEGRRVLARLLDSLARSGTLVAWTAPEGTPDWHHALAPILPEGTRPLPAEDIAPDRPAMARLTALVAGASVHLGGSPSARVLAGLLKTPSLTPPPDILDMDEADHRLCRRLFRDMGTEDHCLSPDSLALAARVLPPVEGAAA